MSHTFFKYQGTGNDFVMIDNRDKSFPKDNAKLVEQFCDRRFGIGADGLILLEDDEQSDFQMVYFNADGNPGSMCGNGGRCAVAFANFLGIIKDKTTFMAVDGLHQAEIKNGNIRLYMQDVSEIREKPQAIFLDTGSPHHIQLVKGLEDFDVFKEGKRLRYAVYGESGSNINFVEQRGEDVFAVRTYERGVEDETLSCGTGVTAVALAMHKSGKTSNNEITVNTRGGDLRVAFVNGGGTYTSIYLEGPAEQVYKGQISW
ncbi:MAG: diaminopimelate epimerase [Bacteroidota bacterium]